MDGQKNSIFLEADDSEFKKKLLLPENLPDDLENLLPFLEGQISNDEVPWKWVQPLQGICVKCRLANGEKMFINICHTPDIPAPKNLDEETLIKVYASLGDEDAPDMGIRMPLSIGEAHEELDKEGSPCLAYDVAINSDFLEKARSSTVHMRFLMQVTLESVRDKFKLEMDVDNYMLLKNRKAMGRLQRHRIELRDVKEPLIQELGPSTSTGSRTEKPAAQSAPRAKIEVLDPQPKAQGSPARPPLGPDRRLPEHHRLARRMEADGGELLVADIAMADVVSAGEVSFRCNDDRLVVESARRGYKWDVFLPVRVNPEGANASFVLSDRVLNITLPIVAR